MLYAGRRFGLIRFGSRVDVYLPPGVAPLVAEGQTMIAGETVMADLTASLLPRPARAGVAPMSRRPAPTVSASSPCRNCCRTS